MQQQTHLTSNKIPRQPKKYGNRSCFARLKKNFILKCLTTTGVPEIMVQAAGSLVNMATKGKLKSKQLTKWILKKQKEKMPWGKLVCAVAAKLLRIVRAVLISNKPYNSKIAGVAKCSLPKGS